MIPLLTSLVLLSAGLLGNIYVEAGPGTPLKQEQSHILKHVQEVVDGIKNLVEIEMGETEESVVTDTNKLVQRGQETLSLLEELALIKLVCGRSEYSLQNETESKHRIQKTIQEGYKLLEQCTERVSLDLRASFARSQDVASGAASHAQTLIETVSDCTRRPGLQQLGCYRRVAASDVLPMKAVVLKGIESHKKGHLRTVEIRNFANDCVDQIVGAYQDRVANILTMAVHKSVNNYQQEHTK